VKPTCHCQHFFETVNISKIHFPFQQNGRRLKATWEGELTRETESKIDKTCLGQWKKSVPPPSLARQEAHPRA
jgi:hypothetical protein